MVRHWVLVPAFAGSNPADPAKYNRLGLVSSLLYLMDSPEFEGLRFVIEHSEIDFPADPIKRSAPHRGTRVGSGGGNRTSDYSDHWTG